MRAAEIAAAAAVLVLTVLLLVPRGPRAPAARAPIASTTGPARALAPGAGLPEPALPEQIARLFGWRPPVPPPAAAPPAPAAASPPAPADWLAYVGFVADRDGERFLFKDRRTGKVVPVAAASREWRLVEAREKELIAEHEGKLYALKRGK